MEQNPAGRIVVGTDTSVRADRAVDWAADRAQALGRELLIVHVVPERPFAGSPQTAATYEEQYFANAQEAIGKVVTRTRERHPGLVVTGQMVKGHASKVLAEASMDAELVVVGARGQSAPLSMKLLGGVSDAVAAHSHGPVAIITDEAQEHPQGPVVVGVDDAPEAQAAIALAFQAAQARAVPLVALYAWDIGPQETPWDIAIWSEEAGSIQDRLVQLVDELLVEHKARHPAVEVVTRVVRDRPHDALVHASKQAGLVVVGSRGRGGFAGLLLGSTSKRVMREALCPVIVVRKEHVNG
ncbi:MAG: universal stress protein [Brooklawnia sp.]